MKAKLTLKCSHLLRLLFVASWKMEVRFSLLFSFFLSFTFLWWVAWLLLRLSHEAHWHHDPLLTPQTSISCDSTGFSSQSPKGYEKKSKHASLLPAGFSLMLLSFLMLKAMPANVSWFMRFKDTHFSFTTQTSHLFHAAFRNVLHQFLPNFAHSLSFTSMSHMRSKMKATVLYRGATCINIKLSTSRNGHLILSFEHVKAEIRHKWVVSFLLTNKRLLSYVVFHFPK